MISLYAISDLHLAYERNRQALLALPAYPDDWLIIAGDVGESETHLTLALRHLTQRFARVIWTPGNHELWTMPSEMLCGAAKYRHLVAHIPRFSLWYGATETEQMKISCAGLLLSSAVAANGIVHQNQS